MKVAVPKESLAGEKRVALIPDACAKLQKAGLDIVVQSGAGVESSHSDEAYQAAGASIESDARALLSGADIVVKVNPPGTDSSGLNEIEPLKDGAVLITFLDPLTEFDRIRKLADQKITAISMELVPRITRAQSMHALSSMANIAGYKAVILAANHLPRMFPMMMTAAGTISPARVFVIGAGVAGLQAIATAKRLGAVVSGYDVRPAVREQVESLGGKFVEMDLQTGGAEDKGGYAKEMGDEFLKKQREFMKRVVATQDVVITTAAIPGKKSPVLVTAEMVEGMPTGSVIIDLAAERGGNCELTQCDKIVVEHGVTIMGPSNLPASVPCHASQMYSRNIQTLLLHLVKEGAINLDREDEITAGCLVTTGGEVVHPRIRDLMQLPPLDPPADSGGEQAEEGAVTKEGDAT
ncbi:MAG: Re/Si-specific NAD(P)(+) transhydrogenase subunit alpha [Planctomycetes bacterium]|nr:Re/Si-specific NAD(P)(+) transhydrogenase subunit alpha [Planctomycetota bacterium]